MKNNKIGIYNLSGRALDNFRRMQCRPAYLRYKSKLKLHYKKMGFNNVKYISFNDFCELQIAEMKEKERGQKQLFN